jgi:hypothetical protein
MDIGLAIEAPGMAAITLHLDAHANPSLCHQCATWSRTP